VRRTHINHLVPRVLDIDELYRRMNERGIEMIDAIRQLPRQAIERAQADGDTLLAAGARLETPRAQAAYVEPAIWV
jgi:hypothetical protein